MHLALKLPDCASMFARGVLLPVHSEVAADATSQAVHDVLLLASWKVGPTSRQAPPEQCLGFTLSLKELKELKDIESFK